MTTPTKGDVVVIDRLADPTPGVEPGTRGEVLRTARVGVPGWQTTTVRVASGREVVLTERDEWRLA